MTQQYIVGELSSLLAGLEPAPDAALGHVLHDLRHHVELAALPALPELAREALDLTDRICWTALDHGDATGFRRYASTAVALREFSASANLLP